MARSAVRPRPVPSALPVARAGAVTIPVRTEPVTTSGRGDVWPGRPGDGAACARCARSGAGGCVPVPVFGYGPCRPSAAAPRGPAETGGKESGPGGLRASAVVPEAVLPAGGASREAPAASCVEPGPAAAASAPGCGGPEGSGRSVAAGLRASGGTVRAGPGRAPACIAPSEGDPFGASSVCPSDFPASVALTAVERAPGGAPAAEGGAFGGASGRTENSARSRRAAVIRAGAGDAAGNSAGMIMRAVRSGLEPGRKCQRPVTASLRLCGFIRGNSNNSR